MGVDGKRERTKARQPPSWSERMRDLRRLLAKRRARISFAVSRWTRMRRRTSSGRKSSIVGESTEGQQGLIRASQASAGCGLVARFQALIIWNKGK